MKLLDKIEDFKEEKLLVHRIFRKNVELPENVFNENFISFRAFELDRFYDDIFYNGFTEFLRKISEPEFSFYTVSPSPDVYFFKNFCKFSVFKVPIDCSFYDFMDFLEEDPGDSPADALRYNSETFTLYSNSSSWGIIGSKNWETGIIGFSNLHVQAIFLNSFADPSLFQVVSERIKNLDEMLSFNDEVREAYLTLVESYSI